MWKLSRLNFMSLNFVNKDKIGQLGHATSCCFSHSHGRCRYWPRPKGSYVDQGFGLQTVVESTVAVRID